MRVIDSVLSIDRLLLYISIIYYITSGIAPTDKKKEAHQRMFMLFLMLSVVSMAFKLYFIQILQGN